MNYLERIHLEIILAVETEGSMTAAAESLHLSQSALSHSMSKLEDQLGVKLWQRKGRQLIPTQAGQHLLNTARRLIPQFVRTEHQLIQFSKGERGVLKIGMECHPCYQWLQRVTNPYLQDWPSVDLDIIQKFQFAGIEALLAHEIDIIVTPDPVLKPELTFIPCFDYEQVLVVCGDHPFKGSPFVSPEDLAEETLFTYPVCSDRLDIFSHFLTPLGRTVKHQKLIETTEIMIQMVACGRGVTALPRWLVNEYSERYDIFPIKLGKDGLHKQIHLGIRQEDAQVDYIQAFLEKAQTTGS
ncbi:LysR family transcriptional regulator [Rubritalea marina]|uniref:LysR family transcriptional regulator n=1 Tax=Rubritalea marina TaxID=361055 RepID=UPI00036EBD38|nr:LysR family transcriptional regulator [Rubritalea marina]